MRRNADDLAAILLTEAGWVRRVAARLTRDASADDLAQETWVRALQQRPDPRGGLRGWLVEVMRRLAHTESRADARRVAREHATVGDATAPAADRLLEKAELLRLIGHLVAELEEPYRSTVLLRYYEGLSAAEIARRQELPSGTVRWRLNYALNSLRERLRRTVDRDQALRALGPLAGGGTMLPALKVAVIVAAGVAVAVGVTRVHSGAATATPAGSAEASPAQTGSSDSLQQAQDAYVHGEYDKAIALAKQSTDAEPMKAWRIIGASSCFERDAEGAAAAWQQMDAKGKKFLEYVCGRNEVELPDGAPVM